MQTRSDKEKELAAKEAVKLVRDGQVVGLGTGSTAEFAIRELAELVKAGLQIKGVPTSVSTQRLAESLGIPLLGINTIDSIDLTLDGADEFTPDLTLIKGGGGALLREKIVASLTREQVIIADSSKKVQKLGKFPLPVEVVPFASHYVSRQLERFGGTSRIRMKDATRFLTDQGNYILDTDFGLIEDPEKLAHTLNQIEGVVGHGLFIGLASRVIMGLENQVVVFRNE